MIVIDTLGLESSYDLICSNHFRVQGVFRCPSALRRAVLKPRPKLDVFIRLPGFNPQSPHSTG